MFWPFGYRTCQVTECPLYFSPSNSRPLFFLFQAWTVTLTTWATSRRGRRKRGSHTPSPSPRASSIVGTTTRNTLQPPRCPWKCPHHLACHHSLISHRWGDPVISHLECQLISTGPGLNKSTWNLERYRFTSCNDRRRPLSPLATSIPCWPAPTCTWQSYPENSRSRTFYAVNF